MPILILILSLFMAACDSYQASSTSTYVAVEHVDPGSWSGTANLSPAAVLSLLQGTWEQPCTHSPSFKVIISGDQITQKTEYYANYGCSGEYSQPPLIYTATLVIEGVSSTKPDGYNVRWDENDGGGSLYGIIKTNGSYMAASIDGLTPQTRPTDWGTESLTKTH